MGPDPTSLIPGPSPTLEPVPSPTPDAGPDAGPDGDASAVPEGKAEGKAEGMGSGLAPGSIWVPGAGSGSGSAVVKNRGNYFVKGELVELAHLIGLDGVDSSLIDQLMGGHCAALFGLPLKAGV